VIIEGQKLHRDAKISTKEMAKLNLQLMMEVLEKKIQDFPKSFFKKPATSNRKMK
jgi:hypothetical protein